MEQQQAIRTQCARGSGDDLGQDAPVVQGIGRQIVQEDQIEY
jgi:hypothetical protein